MIKRFLAILAIAFVAATSAGAAGQPEEQRKNSKPTVYMVAGAHFDTQWRWTVQTSINEYIHNTLVQNFALFEQYPDYIFNFEGAVKYRWAKEYYPDLYARLKEYVKAGRWHVSGASWDANDPNIPSIESGIRNILLGQEFYRQEFGILSTDITLPDCFGFGWQLPSVAAHCGLIGFGTQKLAWRSHPFYEDGRKFPFFFGTWRGPDGERLMATLDGDSYSWSPSEPITDNDDFNARLAGTTVPAAYRYYGTGDKGGSVTPLGARLVDDAVHHPGEAYNVRYAASDDMFKDYLWDERLPEHGTELLMDVHATGNYTSKVEMKMLNRRNERTLAAAEGIASMADHFKGMDYPSYTIDESWKRVIWHQFHDDITGTSIPECYEFSYNDEYIALRQMKSVIKSGMSSMAMAMNTNSKGTPVVVYNSVSAANDNLVEAEICLPASYGSVAVYGPDGKAVKSQIVARDGGIENAIYRITVNAHGDIASIVDKRCGRELVRSGEAVGYDAFPGNRSVNWPAWEIMKEVMDRTPETVSDNVVVTAEECGALRAVLKVKRQYAGSTFVQRIILTDGAADERIDVVNTVDWKTPATLLKASFPVAFDAPEATYDIGMAHIRRGNNSNTKYEVIAQQWADMTAEDGSYGVTILNDGRYGWDKPDSHTLRLTLFHTPEIETDCPEQATQDFGPHTFTYSIIGHIGALDPVEADIAADKLNQPQIALCGTQKHTGKLGKTFSLASTSNPALRIKAFKKAQDGDGYIVRLYELSGKGAEGQIRFGSQIASAEEANGIEDRKGNASWSGNSLDVKSDKFALKTFRVRFAEPSTQIGTPEYKTLELPFDFVAITTDNFTSQGRIGRSCDSFAAEQIPDNFDYRGIPFTFGEADFKSAVTCSGQKIAVPKGARSIHLLVASCADDGNAVCAQFKAGDKTYGTNVANYTGFYGVYGWPGYYESGLRTEDVAYVGSHTHNYSERNKAYVFSYMYLVSIPVKGATELELPSDKNVMVFAATAEMQ